MRLRYLRAKHNVKTKTEEEKKTTYTTKKTQHKRIHGTQRKKNVESLLQYTFA